MCMNHGSLQTLIDKVTHIQQHLAPAAKKGTVVRMYPATKLGEEPSPRASRLCMDLQTRAKACYLHDEHITIGCRPPSS